MTSVLGRSLVSVVVLGVSVVGACSPADQPAPTGNQAGSSTTTAGSGGATTGSAGTTSSSGSGGVPGAAGSVPVGGSSAGGSVGGGAGMAGSAGAAAGGSAGGGGGVLCPTDATFCSGFEDTALPTGAVYKFNAAPGEWTRDFAVDTTLFHSGKSSLRVKSGETGASGAYQMLAVPAPTAKFWVRLYMQQTELDIGGDKHNPFGGAASSDEPNSPVMIEFAEDVGIAFNTSDDVRWPMGYGRINGTPMPFKLLKGMWHCVELYFDSETREQKLFIEGVPQIDATDYPKTVAQPVKIFKFGLNALNGPTRKLWFDDVAVGPTRAGCL